MGIKEPDSLDFGDIPKDRMDNINIVLGAYRSIRHPVAYASMPITSGKLFYDVLEHKGVKTLEELSKKDSGALYNEIIKPNIENGIKFADSLKEQIGLPPLAPSVFEAKKQSWSQKEYMFMWFRVIEERAEEMHMMDGWEYSNGGVQEFTRAMEMQLGFINPSNGMEHFPQGLNLEEEYNRIQKIKVYSQSKNEIRLDDGFFMVSDAIKDLDKRGFEYDNLFTSLHKLISVAGSFYQYLPGFKPEYPPYHINFTDMARTFKPIQNSI